MIDLVHDKRLNCAETVFATCRPRLVRLQSLCHRILRYRSWRSRAIAVSLASGVALAAPPASAQWVVFDPNNYAQNLLTAARALEQINNQIRALPIRRQMLINQAKNLANLPTSTLTQLQSSIRRPKIFYRRRKTSPSMCRRSSRPSQAPMVRLRRPPRTGHLSRMRKRAGRHRSALWKTV